MHMLGNIRTGIVLVALLGTFITLPRPLLAVPAAPDLHSLEQPDLSHFTARQWGDENSSGWETEEGYTIVFDGGAGSWAYADHDGNGALASSGRYVGRDLPPGHVEKRIRPRGGARKGLLKKATTRELAPAGGGTTASASPWSR